MITLLSLEDNLSKQIEPVSIIEKALKQIKKYMGADFVAIWILNKDEKFDLYANIGISKTFQPLLRPKIGSSYVKNIFKNKTRVFLKSKFKELDKKLNKALDKINIKVFAGASFTVNNQPGLIFIYYLESKEYKPETLKFFEGVTTQFFLTLETLNLSLKSNKDLKKRIKILSLLYKSNQALTSVLNIDKILKLVTDNALSITNAVYCSLRLLEEPGKLVRKTFSAKSYIDMKQKLVLNIGESLAGRAMLDKKPVYCENIQKSKVYSVPGEARRLKLYSLLAIPLLFKGKAVGVLTVYTRRVRIFSRGEYKALTMFANQAALVIENARLFENLKTNYLRTIHALAALIDTKDTYTRGHSEAVMQYACGMAEKLRLNKKDIEIIKYASLLHDLGKIGIKLDILRKPSSLSKTEWKSIEKHSQIGADIIKQVGFLDKLVPIILFHHKWYDGRGYPENDLRGKAIPVGARIIAVADAFQAMISDRPYRSKRNIDYAKKELKKWTNTQFDPVVVKVFLNMLDKMEIKN